MHQPAVTPNRKEQEINTTVQIANNSGFHSRMIHLNDKIKNNPLPLPIPKFIQQVPEPLLHITTLFKHNPQDIILHIKYNIQWVQNQQKNKKIPKQQHL